LRPGVFLGSGIFDGLLDSLTAGGEMNPPVIRERFRGESPEDTTQVVIDRKCDELTLGIEVGLQILKRH
jgi:hypothetical protein